MNGLKTIEEQLSMSENAALASPELSERHSVDYDGPLNIFYTCDCELKSVLVNLRNAVICRSAKPQIMKGTSSLLVFKRLPSNVDHDSFRVEINNHRNEYKTIEHPNNICLSESATPTPPPPPITTKTSSPPSTALPLDEGSQLAYIQDVRFHINQLNEDDNKLFERYNCLLIQLRKEKRRYHYLINRYQRLFKQQNVLETFSNNLLWNVNNEIKDYDINNYNNLNDYDNDPIHKLDYLNYSNDYSTYNHNNNTTTINSINGMKLPSNNNNNNNSDFPISRRHPHYHHHQQQQQKIRQFHQNKSNNTIKSHRTRSLTRMKNMIKDCNVKEKNSNSTMIIQNEILQLNQVEAMRNFFTLYTVQSQQLDEDTINVSEELEQCRITMNQLTEQLDEIELCRNHLVSKELHVLLEAHSSLNPDLEITYTVDHVSWTPSYDIRLSSSTATLKIIYYGTIRQNTGEDWELGKLTLSTAEQDHFNDVPQLKLEQLSFKNSENVVRRRQQTDKFIRKSKARSFHSDDSNDYQTISSLFPLKEIDTEQYHCNECKNETYNPINQTINDSRSRLERSFLNGGNHQRSLSTQRYYTNKNENHLNNDLDYVLTHCPSSSLDSIIFRQDNGNKQLFMHKSYSNTYSSNMGKYSTRNNFTEITNKNYFPSLAFDIPKPPKYIKGNGEPHRVIIGKLEFKPKLQYITIPKQTPKAFLRVTMHNISEYALLEGQASVYIDSNFIGKTKLSATAVQEEFTCELGYDPGIRVTYMPKHKYKKTGTFLGNKTTSIVFKQVISVENSYPRSMKLLVIDQLPVSTEDKLKIHLIEPSIKNPEKYDPTKPIRISKTKSIEWDIELAPYESRELVLKYLVEHPSIKDIDISTLGI
ncbi:hypothetical protein MS3_00010292 [Schistosoma haematobium]|uniref:DUF4139 domain-containing protein n=1 Tax=Schistosoma haematobium TaxID=6185 RepID=A0A922S1H4_SCHHA|nr:hypothetical protein MS3_00010292 [Schistosoma haematobium]KAH9589745.1 hypothetical protein MS3_00010292 [Schistosoma haematobium]